MKIIKTYFLLGRRDFRRFELCDHSGSVEEFHPDKAVWTETGVSRPNTLDEPVIDCRMLPHNNSWAFLSQLAEFVRVYQSDEWRSINKAENVWIQVDFHNLQHDGKGSFSCTPATHIVLNPFIAPRITALKSIPNHPLQTLLDLHGGKSYDKKTQTNFTKGSLFHKKVEYDIAGMGKDQTEVNREFIHLEPWSALASSYEAFSVSDGLYQEFRRHPAAQTYRQAYRDHRLDIETDFLNPEHGLLGKEDFVRENTDGTASEVIDLKSGGAYHADRQQIYLYLEANDNEAANVMPNGKIFYKDKDMGFREMMLRSTDKNTTDKWGATFRGFCDYEFYRNNWVLQFLYASFVPEFYVKSGDLNYVNLDPMRKEIPSCEPWTQKNCKVIVPQYGICPQYSTPCSEYCIGTAAKRTFRLPTKNEPRHLYFKWMVSLVHKQAMLEYLEFQYFCNRPLKNLKESCRVVVNAIFHNMENGVVSFHVPKDDDHSDFCEGTGIIIVPYNVEPSPNYPNDRQEDIGKPIRETSGKIRFLRGTVTKIDASGNEFKRFWVTVTNPFPERFLKRYKTFSFQESSFDSSSSESQVLFQSVLGDPNATLYPLLLNDKPLEPSEINPNVKRALDWMNELRVDKTQNFFEGGKIDENKIRVVAEAISAKSLYMIQGPPGTGKTFSIILIALYYLIFTKKNIKIATFTNNAAKRILAEFGSGTTTGLCDLIIQKLEELKQNIHPAGYDPYKEGAILWAGKYDSTIKPDFQINTKPLADAMEHGEVAYQKRCDDIKKRIRILVGTTHSLFSNSLAMNDWRAEDTVTIIDEASQLTEPKTLLGLANSEKYILVGDEKQLSPVVPNCEEIPIFVSQDRNAQENESLKNSTSIDTRVPETPFYEPLRKIKLENFNESLFERFLRLYSQVPGHHGQLEVIYRGPIELYEFSNQEYYDGTLQAIKKPVLPISQVADPLVLQRNLFRATLIYIPCYDSEN